MVAGNDRLSFTNVRCDPRGFLSVFAPPRGGAPRGRECPAAGYVKVRGRCRSYLSVDAADKRRQDEGNAGDAVHVVYVTDKHEAALDTPLLTDVSIRKIEED